MKAKRATSERFESSLLDVDDAEMVGRIVELLDEVLKRGRRTHEWFNWKHRDNPQGRSIVAVAIDSDTGRLAAVRVLWRMDLQDGRRSIVAYQPCDTATREEYQRHGLFTRLTDLALGEARRCGAELLFNFPNKQSRPGNLKLGWVDVGDLSLLVRPFRWLRFAAMTLRARGQKSQFRELDSERPAEPFDWPTSSETAKGMGGLLRGSRDAVFLKWRFEDHPLHRYRLISHKDGAVVGRLGQRSGLREFRAVGWLGAAASDVAVARGCIQNVRSTLRPDVMSTMLHRDHPLYSALVRDRFLPMRSPAFVVKALANGVKSRETRWAIDGTEKDSW